MKTFGSFQNNAMKTAARKPVLVAVMERMNYRILDGEREDERGPVSGHGEMCKA